jgi:hypothetical protein
MKDRDLGAAADLQGKDSGMWASPSSNPPLSPFRPSWFVHGSFAVHMESAECGRSPYR